LHFGPTGQRLIRQILSTGPFEFPTLKRRRALTRRAALTTAPPGSPSSRAASTVSLGGRIVSHEGDARTRGAFRAARALLQALLGTGNCAGAGEETGRLHVEWETGSVPAFVWPTEGDRVKLFGSWIWDCGHWGQSFTDPDYFLPGSGETPFSTNVPGESTEFHPMQAMIVTRANPYLPQVTETESDVYISNDGTIAHAEEQCALEHPPPAGSTTYWPDYSA